MCDEYDDHAKKYFSTEDEFKLDRVRNYFSPIKTYFELKKVLSDPETSEDKKEEIQKILDECEEQCNISIEKINKFLKAEN